MHSFDVIVVGAGPAGATTARHLARSGLKTLLLEKEKIPRYKPCGGGVTAKVARVLDVDFSPTVEDTIEGLSVAYGWRKRFPVQTGRTLGWCVMRDKFDAVLAEYADKAGAELRDNSPVTRVQLEADGARVQTRREELRAEVVVGADGANGIVARAAGLNKSRRIAAALEAEMDLSSSAVETWRRVWHLDYAAIPGGYGWIFPKAEHLSVGVGTFRPEARLNLRQVLNRYLASEPTLQSPTKVKLRGHLLPMGGRGAPAHAPRVMLVGDAAALTDPFTGEGIYAAIKSGAIAAEEIARGFASGNFSFANYSRRVHDEFTRDYRYAWALNQLFYRVPRLAVEALARLTVLQEATAAVIESDGAYGATFQRVLKYPLRKSQARMRWKTRKV